MRDRFLNELHIGHLGVTKCIELAKQTMYWPGINVLKRSYILVPATLFVINPSYTVPEPRRPTPEPEPDYCVGSPCQNGGTCYNTTGDYVCVCRDSYIGKNCTIGKKAAKFLKPPSDYLHSLLLIHDQIVDNLFHI